MRCLLSFVCLLVAAGCSVSGGEASGGEDCWIEVTNYNEGEEVFVNVDEISALEQEPTGCQIIMAGAAFIADQSCDEVLDADCL